MTGPTTAGEARRRAAAHPRGQGELADRPGIPARPRITVEPRRRRAHRKATGQTYAHTTIWKLRNGPADNPQMRLIDALARTFGVPPVLFFNDQNSQPANRSWPVPAIASSACVTSERASCGRPSHKLRLRAALAQVPGMMGAWPPALLADLAESCQRGLGLAAGGFQPG